MRKALEVEVLGRVLGRLGFGEIKQELGGFWEKRHGLSIFLFMSIFSG